MATERLFVSSLLLLTALLLGPPPGARAQHVSVRGQVVSSDLARPLADVLVVLDSGQRSKTDKKGAFRLDKVPPGTHRVLLVAAGCQTADASLEAVEGQDLEVAFPMAFDAEVAAEARRLGAQGKVVSASQLERYRARRLSDALASLFPGLVGADPSQPGGEARIRSRTSVSGSGPVEPAVILDGQLLGSAGFSRVNDIAVADVAWIQVPRGASGGWEAGSKGSGGIIRIQTQRGPRVPAPISDPTRCDLPAAFSGGD